MKDLKIEYRDGKLIELVIDGEQQDASTTHRISLSHEAGGIAELHIGRHYHLTRSGRAGAMASERELIEK